MEDTRLPVFSLVCLGFCDPHLCFRAGISPPASQLASAFPLTVSHGLWVKSFPGHTSALPSSDLASALEVSPANPCQSHAVLQLPQVCYWSPRLTRLYLCTCFSSWPWALCFYLVNNLLIPQKVAQMSPSLEPPLNPSGRIVKA